MNAGPGASVVRCFIAIHLPPDVRAELASIEDKLKARRHPFVKWVEPDSMHLTLKFLGNAAVDCIPQIIDAMSGAARSHAPFSLQLAGTGAFPGWQRPQVIWVGLEGQLDRLEALQRDLEATVSPLGFPTEPRPFSAHLTLGRLRDHATTDDRRRFAQFAQTAGATASLAFQVDAIRLIRSQLARTGPIYSDLAVARLGPPAECSGTRDSPTGI